MQIFELVINEKVVLELMTIEKGVCLCKILVTVELRLQVPSTLPFFISGTVGFLTIGLH